MALLMLPGWLATTAVAASRDGGEATAQRWRAAAPVARTPIERAQRPERHLIVIPGGGFTFHDRGFWPAVAPIAKAAGFVPHLLEYQLFDLSGAVSDAREKARELIGRHGRANVFAYGSSAGGTLAALLAAEGLATAAVASSGMYDLRDWPWLLLDRNPGYLASIGADRFTSRSHSPIRHRLRCPLLALHGSWDAVVSVFQAEDYVATRPRANLRTYEAGHGLYRTRPGSILTSMRWLNRTAQKQAKTTRASVARGSRTAEVARRIRCA